MRDAAGLLESFPLGPDRLQRLAEVTWLQGGQKLKAEIVAMLHAEYMTLWKARRHQTPTQTRASLLRACAPPHP